MSWVNVGNLKGEKGDTGGVDLKTSFVYFNHDFIQYIDVLGEGRPYYPHVSGVLKGIDGRTVSTITDGEVTAYIGNPANNGSVGQYESYSVSDGNFYYSFFNHLRSTLYEVYVVFSKSTSYTQLKEKIYVLGYMYSNSASGLTNSYTIYSGDNLNFYYSSGTKLGNVMAIKLDPDNQLEQGIGVFSSASSGLGFYVNYNYLWAIYNGSKHLIASGIPLGPDNIMVVTKYNDYPRIMFFDGKGNLIFSCDTDIATLPTSGNIGAIGNKNTIYY